MFCNVNGVKTEFIVVNQGKPSYIYDDSCDGTWLLMKDAYDKSVWNSSDVNSYKDSVIHSYLNSTFLTLFDSNIQNVIKQVKIPYVNGTGGSSIASGANGLSTKIFLLSGYEVGISGKHRVPNDGAKLSYFTSGTGTSANNKRVAYFGGKATPWDLRSPDTNTTTSAWYIEYDGDCNLAVVSNTSNCRPAFILPFDTQVDFQGNIVI